jgi:major type 1 subunit fimbrin (pilin)
MKTKILAALVAVGAAQAVSAFDGTITFNGVITPTTCTINGGNGGNDFAVELPTVEHTAVDFNQAAGRTLFQIVLTDCTPASGSVHTYFEPINSNIDAVTGYLQNTAAAGATNVEISLRNGDGTWIDLRAADGGQNSKAMAISSGGAVLKYYAEYQGVNNLLVEPGLVTSAVVYSLAYQ